MELPDPLLRAGYDACMEYIFSPLGLKMEEARKIGRPYIPEASKEAAVPPFEFKTPTGKFELDSMVLKKYADIGLDSLPTYRDSPDGADPAKYPMVPSSGVRHPTTLHSRLHDVPWLRSQRPEPAADINADDAARLGITPGSPMEIFTACGSVTVKANPSIRVQPGSVLLYHGYREADANSLMPSRHNDPYSGFPGYLTVRCGIRPAGGGGTCDLPEPPVPEKRPRPVPEAPIPGSKPPCDIEKCSACAACAISCMNQWDIQPKTVTGPAAGYSTANPGRIRRWSTPPWPVCTAPTPPASPSAPQAASTRMRRRASRSTTRKNVWAAAPAPGHAPTERPASIKTAKCINATAALTASGPALSPPASVPVPWAR